MKSLVDCRRRTLRNRVRAAVRRSSVLKTAILAACAFAAVTLAWGCEEMGGRGKCPVEVETVATGLTEPRGMASGPDGRLYVAETGRDESGSRVVRIEEDGAATAVVAGLPIFLHGIEERLGAQDVAFRDGELFVLQGYAESPLGSSLIRRSDDGGLQVVANLQDVLRRRFQPSESDPYAPVFSNPFALAYAPDTDLFYVVDSGANAVYSITPAGVSEVVFQWTDNPVPTGIAIGPEGDLYVALFTHLPYETGAGSIVRVAPDGAAAVVTSLTTPIDVGFDSDGRMYVLEFSGGYDPRGPEGLFKPDSGRLLRIDQSKREVLLDGLSFPTRMFFSPTGELYLVHGGALSAPGAGGVMKVTPCERLRRASSAGVGWHEIGPTVGLAVRGPPETGSP